MQVEEHSRHMNKYLTNKISLINIYLRTIKTVLAPNYKSYI